MGFKRHAVTLKVQTLVEAAAESNDALARVEALEKLEKLESVASSSDSYEPTKKCHPSRRSEVLPMIRVAHTVAISWGEWERFEPMASFPEEQLQYVSYARGCQLAARHSGSKLEASDCAKAMSIESSPLSAARRASRYAPRTSPSVVIAPPQGSSGCL